MIIQMKRSPPGGADGPLELSSYGGVDCSESAPEIAPAQAENSASEITLMHPEELRGCLVREIFRAALIGMQAQTALLDGDDDLALDNLRRHWRVMRAGVTPLACELLALRRAGAP
jgi:hypothetical protein